MNDRLKSTLKMTSNVGIGVSFIASFFADFLKPIAPFALYLLLFLLVLMAVSLVVRTIPFLNLKAEKTIPSVWYAPLFFTILISFVVMTITYQLGKNSGSNGYLAENFQLIDDMQSELGLINKNIEKLNRTTEVIKTNTEKTAINTGSIDKKMDELITSSDPRKELANLGITWSVDSLAQAITAGDLQTIELFDSGGFSPNQARIAIEKILYEGYEPIKTLEYLFQNEKFGIKPNDFNFLYDAILDNNDDAVEFLISEGSDYNVHRTDTFWGRGRDRYYLKNVTPACFASFIHEVNKTIFKDDVPKSKSVIEVFDTKETINEGHVELMIGLCSFKFECPSSKASNKVWGCI